MSPRPEVAKLRRWLVAADGQVNSARADVGPEVLYLNGARWSKRLDEVSFHVRAALRELDDGDRTDRTIARVRRGPR